MGSIDRDILLIGGGLGSLCLAQGLRKAGIAFRVFERDVNASWSPQGYRLRINGEGANALRETLSPELWERFEETCCSAEPGETDINAVSGMLVASRAGGSPVMKGMKPYTCDRKVLQDILLDGLEDRIAYGKELERYDIDVDRREVIAYFRDGTVASTCFLVGADGKGSATREQYLADQLPLDTEACAFMAKPPPPPNLSNEIDDIAITLLLEPIRFTKKGDQFDQYMPEDYMYWVLIARKQILNFPSKEHLAKFTGEEVAVMSLRIPQCWDPSIRSILHSQDKEQTPLLRVLYKSRHGALDTVQHGHLDWGRHSRHESLWRC